MALLVTPGVDLLAVAYGCWRAGAVIVVADRGLGLRGLGAAVRAAHVQWVIGPAKAIAAARVLRWAPRATFISIADPAGPEDRRTTGATTRWPRLGAVATVDELIGRNSPLPPAPRRSDPAAVLYTSGATGPAKGVRYRHDQIAAQRDALRDLYGITSDDRLVAAFAPFALYGPALGIASTIPDVDVTAPGTLTVDALGRAVSSIRASIVFASPAALANVNRTATDTAADTARVMSSTAFDGVRLVLSAGAPVPIATLQASAELFANASLHTPYGMTECLPVADVELDERIHASAGRGVCVGSAVAGADVMIVALGFDPADIVTALADGATGEVMVRAPWLSEGYDQLWRTQHDARPMDGTGRIWHRTGDVGHIDPSGRLWIEGRNVHVIHAVDGPVTPVPVEVAVESIDGIERAAAVGVGPVGCQQLVVVVENPHMTTAGGLADADVTDAVRRRVSERCGATTSVAAVLTVTALPVDIRHNTKIDRTAVASWAAAVLAGDRRPVMRR